MGEKKILGVLGHPLSHTKSPTLFKSYFYQEGLTDWEYGILDYPSVEDFLQEYESQKNLKGFNVTIPFKQKIIPFLDKLSSEATELQAVNTVVCSQLNGNRFWVGYNTDVYGFEATLNKLKNKYTHAIILGSGGASAAVQWVLEKRKTPFVIVSRTPKSGYISYSEISEHMEDSTLFINCTPVGMKGPYPDHIQLPYSQLKASHMFIDLVYNPEETGSMALAKKQGVECLNGQTMLEAQAQKSWSLFKELK